MMRTVATSGKRNRRRRGILTFEWILLISLLVIGVIGGLTEVRNTLICELIDLTDCIEAIACCSTPPPPPPAPIVFGQDPQAECTTCGVNGGSSGNWWGSD